MTDIQPGRLERTLPVQRLQDGLRWLLGGFLILMGVLHFARTDLFVQIVPPFLPWPFALVWLSGVAEIVLGVTVLIPSTRRLAAWGIILLLIAVYPANIYMAVANVQVQGLPAWIPPPTPRALWLRLPFQFVLMAWAWWCARPRPASASHRA